MRWSRSISTRTISTSARSRAGSEGKSLEKTAQFWSRKEIAGGKHLVWLQDEKRAKKDEGTDKTRFALYSYTGNGFIDAFPLNKKKVTVVDSGRLAGIKINKITLTADLDQENSGSVGDLDGTWELPKKVKANKGTSFKSTLNSVAGKKYAGALSSLPPPEVDLEGASPVSFGEVNFVRGKLSADGKASLKPNHPALSGRSRFRRSWHGWPASACSNTLSMRPRSRASCRFPGVTIDDGRS
jgi:hypothetical protein